MNPHKFSLFALFFAFSFVLPGHGFASTCQESLRTLLASVDPPQDQTYRIVTDYPGQAGRILNIVNADFLDYLEQEHACDHNVIFVMNGFLKRLNDTIFRNKDISESFTTFYKVKLYQELKKSLGDKVSLVYSDYKVLTIVVAKDAGYSDKDLAKIVEDAVTETAKAAFSGESRRKYPEVFAALMAYNAENPGSTLLPEHLFQTALARSSSMHAALGLAEMVARLARDLREPFRQLGQSDLTILRDKIAIVLHASRELRSKLPPDLLDNGLPSIGLLELFKKYGDQPTLPQKIRQRYPTLSLARINGWTEQLQEFYTISDSLAFHIFTNEQSDSIISDAVNGLVSVDATSQGVHIVQTVMRTLVAIAEERERDKTGSENQLAVKAAKRLLEAQLIPKNRLSAIMQAFADVASQEGVLQTSISGDDGIALLRESSRKDVINFFRNLAHRGQPPSNYRTVFLPQNYAEGAEIPGSERSKLVILGESVEKSLREKLEATIPYARLQKVMIAVILEPHRTPPGKIHFAIVGAAGPGGRTAALMVKRFITEPMLRAALGSQRGTYVLGDIFTVD